jgi:hypothetical protein
MAHTQIWQAERLPYNVFFQPVSYNSKNVCKRRRKVALYSRSFVS